MSIWHFTRGYVKIELHCSRPENAVNSLLAEGICLHNIRRISLRAMDAVVPMRDYVKLCSVSDALGCDVKVIEQNGLPVFLRCMKGRPVLVAVLVAGLAAMLFLSKCIWIVRIDGCDRVSADIVMQALSAADVGAGTFKSKLDLQAIKETVSSASPDIGFVDIRIDGTVLTVAIQETANTDFNNFNDNPSSIYADRDCIIVEISARSGKAAVKKGDAVKRGAILIDGNITASDGSVKKVKSEGTVVGRVVYRLTATESPTALGLVRSGNECEYVKLRVFDAAVTSQIPYTEYELEGLEERTLDSCGIPIIAERGRCYELVEGTARRDSAEMIETAMNKAESKLMNAVPQDARIIMKKSETVWNEDGSVTAIIIIETIENIGYTRFI